ncbi:MAG: ribosome biogenesis GTPase Der [Candidatus Dadabacteria bacterium]|nr:ribosome biogenesis GTPase Der [Candidatus Dadabacteria bacterium]MYA48048.1 ribosome biogenesis GTPase Der [Candidatus Dadabacteria bacterium]MYG82974.1 ribosome biogenesis GTPase Der [Candidatus Dadabacteria bacterium]MYK49115.1 ribosome biogenesis GTPase Der [Candidatus Dadabacteria bacterium]
MNGQKPIVAIVGRPNVGKSTLFNRIIGWNKTIVEDIPGVTRDRVYEDTRWKEKEFTLVDTGGLSLGEDDEDYSLIKEQIDVAISEADLVVMLFDGQDGALPQDSEIVQYLRRTEKKVIYAVNKVDHGNIKQVLKTYEFYGTGSDEFMAISALHNKNIYELVEQIASCIEASGQPEEESEESEGTRIAVIGKPNVGKSTLVNRILGEYRLITSPTPGTTRDPVDSIYEKDGKKYVFIDTAGIRRKSRIDALVEKHSVFRAIRSIERAHIVLLMIDGQEGPTHHDSRLAELVKDRNRALIILLNKWDLAPEDIADPEDIEEITKERLVGVDYAPVLTISALTGKKVGRIFDVVERVESNFRRKLPTGKLNRFLEDLTKRHPPPVYRRKEIKLFYISQPFTAPPTFTIFTNSAKGIPENYRRFLENQLRTYGDFEGVPLKLLFRDREGKEV